MGLRNIQKEQIMYKTNTRNTDTNLSGSNLSRSAGAGTRGVCLDHRPVRTFQTNTRNQHPQDLGGVGYGVKEETSTLYGEVSFRDKVRALTQSGYSEPEMGKGNGEIVWDPRLWAGITWGRAGTSPTNWTSPADQVSAGPSPVHTATAALNRKKPMS